MLRPNGWSALRRGRTDVLTGLLDRRGLQARGRRLLADGKAERLCALLLLDLADFRVVNDSLGYAAGDALLREVAAALRARVRRGDLVARLGGDEFAVLLADVPDGMAAQLRAERLLAGLRKTPFTVEGIALSVDASVGIALAPEHGRSIERLLQHAHVALNETKAGHRGTSLYNPAADEHNAPRLALVAELRRALDHGEFVLHYQPKIALPSRRVYGMEALARWQHPARGLLPPGEFLPLLERTGLLQPFSEWVVRAAAQQAADWRRAGLPLRVAVNLSTRSLLNPALPAKVLAILAGADLPPDAFELEITETALMSQPEKAVRTIAQLRARGVEVSIDDFGAGYTSLAYLRLLPVSALKIDRTLTARLLESPQDEAIIRAVIELGHCLGLRVIAEGVESQPALDRLTALACDRAQGYAISPPLPALQLESWLADQPVGEVLPVIAR